MGKKEVAPKLSEEEKQAAKMAKLSESLAKACKNDDLKKVEDALSKGADVNHMNGHGHTAAHMAAAFGALKTIRCLHAGGADLTKLNTRNRTPLQTAHDIGEPKAAKLIEVRLSVLDRRQ